MKVLWICSMTMMIALALAQSDWYPCNKCLCLNSTYINCHGVVVILEEDYMRIECPKSEKGKTNYTYLWENIDIKNIRSIYIRNCSLPDGAVFGEIGIENGGVWYIEIYDYGIHGWSDLTKDHFQNLPKLEWLIIEGNANLNLTDDFFEANSKLETLLLNINQVHMSADIFSILIELTVLSINTKHKLIVPDGLIKHNPKLSKLELRQEQVTLTNETYNTLTGWPEKLEHLNISGTFPVLGKLTYHHLKDLPKLDTLQLSRLNITEIENDAFKGTPKIETLDLRGNQLTTIDSLVFRHLPKMISLDLSENRISNFIIKEYKLNSVRYINLNHNRFKVFDFSRLKSLDKLEINNNLLESLRIKNMIYLDSSYNRLNEESLHINYWLIDAIEINSLNISHNSLKRIKFLNSYWKRLNVVKLDLSFNNISTISIDDMNFLSKSATTTDLRNNLITTIHPINIIEPKNTAQYSTVDVREVPFDCTCSIYGLVEYMNTKVKPLNIIVGNSTCSSPSSMKGRLLKDLQACDVVCDEKECPKTCHCHRRPCDNATLATCLLQTMLLFPPEISKLELTIPNSTFDPRLIDEATFQKVSKLLIANNNLSTLTVQHIPDNIQVLDLRNNSISHVGEDVVNKWIGSSSLESTYISGNKIVCDCDNRPLLTFIQNKLSIFKDVQDEKCFNENELIRLVSIADLCGYRKALTISGITVAVAVIIVITCIALYYKYQTEVKVWLFAKGWFISWITEEEIDKDKEYDAFLAWSHKDDDFVLNEILSRLEQGPNPFKICVHYRDWEVGKMINTQINWSIKQSRRTLVVLTPNFLTSPWGMYEFKQAHCHALEESRVRVIVICHGDLGPRDRLDPDLQAYLATKTYLEWGDPRFWEKLMYALPHPTGRTDMDGTVYYRSGMVHFRRRA